MKATLEFTLPDERPEFLRAVRAPDAFRAVAEFGEYLRSQEKYTEPAQRDDLVTIRANWFAAFGDLLEIP